MRTAAAGQGWCVGLLASRLPEHQDSSPLTSSWPPPAPSGSSVARSCSAVLGNGLCVGQLSIWAANQWPPLLHFTMRLCPCPVIPQASSPRGPNELGCWRWRGIQSTKETDTGIWLAKLCLLLPLVLYCVGPGIYLLAPKDSVPSTL